MHSVKDLLARVSPGLRDLGIRAARQEAWGEWLGGHLDPELRAKVRSVTERSGTLTVFAESAAWSARLKFALAELVPRLRAERPSVKDIEVRVMPR
ncbi:MAG: DUF721 domain-containing protein [Proteobacteria bacterium]|nr:DUF721 domain-containing protein [Pseudomonadota bacterium]